MHDPKSKETGEGGGSCAMGGKEGLDRAEVDRKGKEEAPDRSRQEGAALVRKERRSRETTRRESKGSVEIACV